MPGLDRCVALISYEGVGATLVRRLKFHNHRDALGPLADALATLLQPEDGDAVTWVPTTRDRRRERGFDQAELLARRVARRLGVECVAALRRAGDDHQTGRSRADRLIGPSLRALQPIAARRWILVDDVITTGASLRSAAVALRNGGATHVVGAGLARTPAR